MVFGEAELAARSQPSSRAADRPDGSDPRSEVLGSPAGEKLNDCRRAMPTRLPDGFEGELIFVQIGDRYQDLAGHRRPVTSMI